LIWQFDAKSRYALAHDDLAVVKFCTQRGVGFARESYLVRLWSHQACASQFVIRYAQRVLADGV